MPFKMDLAHACVKRGNHQVRNTCEPIIKNRYCNCPTLRWNVISPQLEIIIMKKLGIGCGIVAVLGVIVLIFVIIAGGGYNRLVKLSQGVEKQWAQVQNVYQRR